MQALSSEQPSNVGIATVDDVHPHVIVHHHQRGHRHSLPAINADLSWTTQLIGNTRNSSAFGSNKNIDCSNNMPPDDEEDVVDVDGDNPTDSNGHHHHDANGGNNGKNNNSDQDNGSMSDDEGGLVMITGDEASSSPVNDEDQHSRTAGPDSTNNNGGSSATSKQENQQDGEDDNLNVTSDDIQEEEDRRLLAMHRGQHRQGIAPQSNGNGTLCLKQNQQQMAHNHSSSSSTSSSRHHHHRKQQPPLHRQSGLLLQQQPQSTVHHRSPLIAGRGGTSSDMFYENASRNSSSVSPSPNNQRRHSQQIQDLSSAAIFPPRPGDLLLPHQQNSLKLRIASNGSQDHDEQQMNSGAFYDANSNIRSSVIHAGNNSKMANNRLLTTASSAVNAATAAAVAAAALVSRNNQQQQVIQPTLPPQQHTPSNNNNGNGQGGGNTSALVPMWKDREVIALLDLYSSERYQAKFRDPRNRKIFVWSEISNEINSQFFTGRTGMHCDQKFRNIKSAYKHRVLTNPNVSFVVRTNPIFQKMDAIYKMGLMDINDDGAGLSTGASAAKRNSRVEMPPPLIGQQQQLLLRHLQQQQQHQRHRTANSDDERDDLINEEMMANYRRRASLDVSVLNDAVLQKRLRLQAGNWSPPWSASQEIVERTVGGDGNNNNDHDDEEPNNKVDGPTVSMGPVDLSSAFTTVGNGNGAAGIRRGSRLIEPPGYILNGNNNNGTSVVKSENLVTVDETGDDGDSRFSTTSSPDANRSTASPANVPPNRKMSLISNQSVASHQSLLQQLAVTSSAAASAIVAAAANSSGTNGVALTNTCSGCTQLGQIFLDFLIDMRDTAEVNHRQQSAKFASLIRRMESLCPVASTTTTTITNGSNGNNSTSAGAASSNSSLPNCSNNNCKRN